MIKCIQACFFAMFILACLAAMPSATAEDNGETPRDVLGRLVGTWQVKIVSRPGGADGKEIRRTGTGRTEWFLDRQFVRNAAYDKNLDPSNYEASVFNIWGYDEKQGKYRAWYFDSNGNAGDSEGQYDSDTKTLTFTATTDAEERIVTTIRFGDENTQSWSTSVTDNNGKLVRTLKMELRRK